MIRVPERGMPMNIINPNPKGRFGIPLPPFHGHRPISKNVLTQWVLWRVQPITVSPSSMCAHFSDFEWNGKTE